MASTSDPDMTVHDAFDGPKHRQVFPVIAREATER
jgi:hypothetical protein